jgi:hypothetical protein
MSFQAARDRVDIKVEKVNSNLQLRLKRNGSARPRISPIPSGKVEYLYLAQRMKSGVSSLQRHGAPMNPTARTRLHARYLPYRFERHHVLNFFRLSARQKRYTECLWFRVVAWIQIVYCHERKRVVEPGSESNRNVRNRRIQTLSIGRSLFSPVDPRHTYPVECDINIFTAPTKNDRHV